MGFLLALFFAVWADCGKKRLRWENKLREERISL
jgi:hypothetical protein